MDLPVVSSLDHLIDQLHQTFSGDKISVEYVNALMSSYKSNPHDWRKYVNFDRHRYTRNLVDEGNGKFNLMILCWSEGQGSSIHDHADAHCFMKMLQGQLSEIRFAWPEESEDQSELQVLQTNSLKLNEVCYINDSLGLHRVENSSHTDTAVSLHLYCPPFDACHMFDQRTGHKIRCPVTFWTRHGQRTDLSTCRAHAPENN